MDKPANRLPADCLTCGARRDGLCAEFLPSALGKMESFKSGNRKIAAGADIFGPGKASMALYNLVEGWAIRYRLLEDGRRQILDFALPGAVFGFHPERGARATYGVQALTDIMICAIPLENLASLSREVPEVGMRLARLLSRDTSQAYDHLMSVGRQSARERVAHLVLELFLRSRAEWPGKRIEELRLPLTQEHLGDATGLTSVHVNRVLADLRAEKVIDFHYRRLRILNPDKLVEIAQIDPQLAMMWIRKPEQPSGPLKVPNRPEPSDRGNPRPRTLSDQAAYRPARA